jgi:hypothetical protein
MHLTRVYGERQQVFMTKQNLVEVEAIADDHIHGTECSASKVTAIGSAVYLDEIFSPLDIEK